MKGTVTAGNSSQTSHGTASLLIMREEKAKALTYADTELKALDPIEFNEAFAAQGLTVMRVLGMDAEKVNGGAIALGHPLGCTGANLTVLIIHELQRQDKETGLVTMCIGDGMGAAGIIQLVN